MAILGLHAGAPEQGGSTKDFDRLKRINEQADAIAAAIQADRLECQRIVIDRLRQELPGAKASVVQLATVYGILADKDHRHQELQAKAKAQGSAAGDVHSLDREALTARREAIRALRAGRN